MIKNLLLLIALAFCFTSVYYNGDSSSDASFVSVQSQSELVCLDIENSDPLDDEQFSLEVHVGKADRPASLFHTCPQQQLYRFEYLSYLTRAPPIYS